MTDKDQLLLTIVTEVALEDIIIEEILRAGVRGYTISDARGLGTHGLRSGQWRKDSNIRVEIIADTDLCERVIELLKTKYERDYGLLMFSVPVRLHN